jgi:hypothetical protein
MDLASIKCQSNPFGIIEDDRSNDDNVVESDNTHSFVGLIIMTFLESICILYCVSLDLRVLLTG